MLYVSEKLIIIQHNMRKQLKTKGGNNKMKKKILSIILVLSMLCAFMPVIAIAETSGTCGDNVIWTLDDNGTLTISGTGDMEDYNYSSSPFYNNSNIKSVIIENDVTSIGNGAFYDCSGLTSVTIPNSVISIGNSAFYGCSELESVYISDLAAYLNIDGESPMRYASKLYLNGKRIAGNITVPDGVTNICNYAFYEYSGITGITFPRSVKSIGDYSFYTCSGLTDVLFSEGLESIGDHAFCLCKMTSINIPSTVTAIGNEAFISNGILKSVYITNLKSFLNIDFKGAVYNSGNSGDKLKFYIDNTLTTDLVIPDGVTKIPDYAFCCSNINSLTACGSMESIGKRAFFSSGIKKITIKKGVKLIDVEAFQQCYNLSSVILGENTKTINEYAFGWTGITSIAIPKSVIEIEKGAFYNCSTLRTIEYGGNDADWNEIFIGSGNDNLKNATINYNSSYWDTAKFQYRIDTAKNGVIITGFDKSETEANIPSTIENLPVIGIDENAFNGCKITKVTIPSSIASIGNDVFADCSSLNDVYISDLEKWCKIDFSNANSNPMSTASNLYLNNELVTALTIPNSITNIKDYAFYGCGGITSVTIPNSITAIGKDAFYGCNTLNNVYISDIEKWCKINFNNANSNPMSCANNLYINNTLTTELTIPNTVTSISDYAFYGCGGLTSVTISNSIKSIGNNAFNQCTNLKDIYYMGSLTIGTNNEPFTNANLHLIGGGVESTPTPTPTVTPTAKPTPTATPTQTPMPSGGYPYVINELSLKTTSGGTLSKAPANTGFIVNTKFTKVQQRTETDYIFVAVYDTKGALLNLDYVQANFAENYTYNVGFYIPPQIQEVGSIKAFVWNTFNGMTPLAESKEL